MNTIYQLNSRVEKIAQEHRIIIDYVAKFNKGYKEQDREFFKGIVEFFIFLEKDLLTHFRYEEIVLFPAFILGEVSYGNTIMVLSLQKEHGAMEEELQRLVTELRGLRDGGEKLTKALLARVKAFMAVLQEHARREMTELYPMLNASAKSKAFMEVYSREMYAD